MLACLESENFKMCALEDCLNRNLLRDVWAICFNSGHTP
jgi:hypothetical protein